MNSNILISVCARGGSKGIPGKNLKDLNGKPLIDYTLTFIEKLKEIQYFSWGWIHVTDHFCHMSTKIYIFLTIG